ncbi:MAG: [FeFe] hydrogenase, group A [Phascolarctobacterium sp.]|nr:[FeFe] hydrogenase, group A [Phascolarctobacterium sp.]
MVNLTIDGIKVTVAKGTTIMQAAANVGIIIPKLCFLKNINEINACKVCVVEIQGQNRVVTACTTPVEEGMVVFTNSPKARETRRTNVELILSQHDCVCATCIRCGTCALQKVATDLGIYEIPYKQEIVDEPWDRSFPLIRDSKKCIKCMRCVQVCDKIQGLKIWDIINTGSRTTIGVSDNKDIRTSDCSLCGQCIIHCPTGALYARTDNPALFKALADPSKVTVCQIAPAVRAAWAEAFNLPEELATEGRLVACLKRIGFDYVFDTNFAADVTIWEEASELIERLGKPSAHKWPMFTSCCPGWVSFVSFRYPEFKDNLSTTKSPQQIFGAIAKSYFAKQIGVEAKDMFSVSVMPCVSKKRECAQPGMRSSGTQDVDMVLTTRALIRLMRSEHINPMLLAEQPFDSPLGSSTGAAVIFGVTGGVMEAALRTAYKTVLGEEAPDDAFTSVRGLEGRKEATFQLGDVTLKTCTVSTLRKAAELLEEIKAGKAHFDFVEVMTCPGGCINGGGQPFHESEAYAQVRSNKLYRLDANRKIRQSHNNPEVQELYRDFLERPLSHLAEELLHSDHTNDGNYAK